MTDLRPGWHEVNEFAYVGFPHECWPARDYKTSRYSKNSAGVSYRKYAGKPAHRLAYELVRGVLTGVPDHLCLRPNCCNPWHMEDVGHGENAGRSKLLSRDEFFCPNGHPWDESNTYVNSETGSRVCRTCRRERMRKPDSIPYDATKCRRGHEWTPENTYQKNDGRRRCRACQKENQRKRKG